jgi:D-alanyl-lipoteichoic acid acyltransferase DltB (MBOAT superfamily)
MLFNSYEFIFVFLPVSVIIFIVCQRVGNKQLTSIWLILCSLFFYAWWNPSYLPLILLSILINFGLANKINSLNRINNSFSSKFVLLIGVSLNLLLLGYFKYANFFIENINLVIDKEHSTLNIVLPLAISFFTFQQITYLVDTHKKNVASHNILDYLLFVTFFPQLIAGPIVHHKEMMPQFSSPKFLILNTSNIAKGLSIFSLGLFKKVIIADYFASLANPIFDQATVDVVVNSTIAWTGAVAYTLQLYFDFSGYSDMAIGLALIFGITLPYNFNSPYKATNIIDFWRRWHMTLSRFLKDYVYIPLGGNKKGNLRRHANLMMTMLLGGLWHGAGWTFILWGLLHGMYLIINHSWQTFVNVKPHRLSFLSSAFGRLLTFLAIIIAWVVFRSENIPTAINIISHMLIINPEGFDQSIKQISSLIFGILLVWFAPNSNEIFSKKSKTYSYCVNYRWYPSATSALVFSIIGFISIIYLARAQEFLYFQF